MKNGENICHIAGSYRAIRRLYFIAMNLSNRADHIRSFFLVCIFLYSDWIRRFMELISVFSRNTGKYGPEKTPYLDTFHTVYILKNTFSQIKNTSCLPHHVYSYFMMIYYDNCIHAFFISNNSFQLSLSVV